MANHAWVYGCKKEWTSDTIKTLADTFCQTVLKGLFHVTVEREGNTDYFMIRRYPDREVLSLQFWTSNHKKSRAIEIQHGHGGDFMWWLDNNWENYLAHHLDGKITDEGCGGSWRAEREIKYPTLQDWVNTCCPYDLRLGRWQAWSVLGHYPDLQAAFWEGPLPERPTTEELARLGLPDVVLGLGITGNAP